MVRKAGPRQIEFKEPKCDNCGKFATVRDAPSRPYNYLCQNCAMEIIKKNQCIKL